MLEKKLDEIETLSHKLADHFCEEQSKFKLEECLDIMKSFCESVRKCTEVRLIKALTYVYICSFWPLIIIILN